MAASSEALALGEVYGRDVELGASVRIRTLYVSSSTQYVERV
jgi:hypothetical protein